MKLILINLIKLYWILKTDNKPKCIFRKSCSNYVYEETVENGFWQGIKALTFRIKNCKNGYELFKHPIDNTMNMILPNKQIIHEEEIAERLLK